MTLARVATFLLALLLAALLLLQAPQSGHAAKIADISNTKHNLSTSGPGTVKATGESQILSLIHI